jgi:hypothetical protein
VTFDVWSIRNNDMRWFGAIVAALRAQEVRQAIDETLPR